MSQTDNTTVLLTVSFAVPEGADIHDILDRITGVLAGTAGVDAVQFLDDRPLDELRRQLTELLTTRFQLTLNDMSAALTALLDGAFKRGVTSLL